MPFELDEEGMPTIKGDPPKYNSVDIIANVGRHVEIQFTREHTYEKNT